MFLLDILEELRKSVPNVLLLAVGDGPDWKKTKEEANKRQLKNHVMFLGVRTDVPELLQAMDLFILPSRFEGQPIAAIEAQIAGLKVILSDTITMDAQLSEYCLWENIQKGAAEWARKVVDNLNYKRLIIKQEDSLVRKFDSKFQSDEINKIFKRTK